MGTFSGSPGSSQNGRINKVLTQITALSEQNYSILIYLGNHVKIAFAPKISATAQATLQKKGRAQRDRVFCIVIMPYFLNSKVYFKKVKEFSL